jgi:predicted PurR-regulated permease PerM
MVPVLVEQTTGFAFALPKYLSELKIPDVVIQETTHQLTTEVGKLPGQVLSITVELFSNVISVISVFLFGLYFTLARRDLRPLLDPYLSKDQFSRVEHMLSKLEVRLGGWARGQFLLMAIVGAANFVGLTVLGVPYAVPLGLLAGILEAVPNLGPIFAAIPAIIVGFGVAPITGVAVIALAFLIQQIEAYLLVPKVMQKSAGVNPIISLLSLIIGFKLAGVVGAVLSIPVVLTSVVFLEEFFNHPHKQE